MLPLPAWRMSIPAIRPARYPKGIDPNRYNSNIRWRDTAYTRRLANGAWTQIRELLSRLRAQTADVVIVQPIWDDLVDSPLELSILLALPSRVVLVLEIGCH